MKNIHDEDTIPSLIIARYQKDVKTSLKRVLLYYALTLVGLAFLALIVWAWIHSPCMTVDWMSVDITVHGGVKTITTSELVPVCIPQP